MLRFSLLVLCLAFSAIVSVSAQTKPTFDVLVNRLNDVRTTGHDLARQIREIAAQDLAAREYVVRRLPEMIKSGSGEPWIYAVWLAGELKSPEAIPALQQAMSRAPFPAEPHITGGGAARLDNDIVAKALSQIGDPAIASTVDLLKSGDERNRVRAVLILRNIGSSAAQKALRNYLPHEPNPEIKSLIQDSLRSQH